ncbi:MAG TPA: Uma2 family endonuclease [Bryobacteraceae bacterium]|nr:Uma2 family endonuclease [Bryobacteraceae bacterium]
MSASAHVTFAEFEQYQDDGMKHELLLGEHIVLPPPNVRTSLIQHRLHDLLLPQLKRVGRDRVFILAGFLLSSDTFLQPDVSFVRWAQLQASDPDGYLAGAPAIAIEVASDSNTAAQLDLKVEQYFAHGSEEVWVVYPKTRKVRVHNPDRNSKTVTGAELRSELFPGWSVAVDSLFED